MTIVNQMSTGYTSKNTRSTTTQRTWGRSRPTGAGRASSFTDSLENQLFRVDPLRVLRLLGLSPELETENELTIACPFHREGRRSNLGLNRHSGLWNCWVCGAKGNLPKLVADVLQINYREALQYLQEHTGLPSITEVRDTNLRELEKILHPPKPADFETIDVSAYRYGGGWWVRFGGFERSTVKLFNLGYDSVSRRGVIPIGFGGRWISTIKRASRDDQQPRYLYESGFDRGSVLYAWDHLPKRTRSCIIVEGPRDTIRLHSYGLTTALGQLGSGITNWQLRLIVDNFDEVSVWEDNDFAGQMSTYYICGLLEGLIPRVYVVPYLVNKKDPNELTQQEALQCIRARMHWSVIL